MRLAWLPKVLVGVPMMLLCCITRLAGMEGLPNMVEGGGGSGAELFPLAIMGGFGPFAAMFFIAGEVTGSAGGPPTTAVLPPGPGLTWDARVSGPLLHPTEKPRSKPATSNERFRLRP